MLNLISGCISIVFILHERFEFALIFHGVSLLCDFLDGMVARALKVDSPLGVQLDSLADVVSFGVAPAAIAYVLLGYASTIDLRVTMISNLWSYLWVFVLTASAAYRLAKFNLSTDQKDSFFGMPTPPMAMYFFGLLLILRYGDERLIGYLQHPWVTIVSVLYFTWIMNCRLKHFKLKFTKSSLLNPYFMSLAGISLALLVFYPVLALSATIVAYTFLSIISNFVKI